MLRLVGLPNPKAADNPLGAVLDTGMEGACAEGEALTIMPAARAWNALLLTTLLMNGAPLPPVAPAAVVLLPPALLLPPLTGSDKAFAATEPQLAAERRVEMPAEWWCSAMYAAALEAVVAAESERMGGGNGLEKELEGLCMGTEAEADSRGESMPEKALAKQLSSCQLSLRAARTVSIGWGVSARPATRTVMGVGPAMRE